MKKIVGGLLVILEGGEGVGKTTQAKALVDYYNSKGYTAKYFREPGGNKLAEDIRNLILYNEMDTVTETLLMSAARNINIQSNILPALRDGNIVILDRFIKSTMVYQGILNNGNMDFINACINEVTKDVFDNDAYTIEFTLLCEPKIAIKRAANNGHERNKYDTMPLEKYKKINDAYRELYKTSYGIRCMLDTSFVSQEDTFYKLVAGIDNIISDCEIDEE